MSNHVVNPHWKPHLDLGIDDATWERVKAEVTVYLRENAKTRELLDADIRQLDPILADERVWNTMAGALNLLPAPG